MGLVWALKTKVPSILAILAILMLVVSLVPFAGTPTAKAEAPWSAVRSFKAAKNRPFLVLFDILPKSKLQYKIVDCGTYFYYSNIQQSL